MLERRQHLLGNVDRLTHPAFLKKSNARLTMLITSFNCCSRIAAGIVVILALAMSASAEGTSSLPRVDCDFPGGNIILDRIEGDHVYLHQDPRDTSGFWFYWYFRVRGAEGRTLTFHFTEGNVIGVRGPAVSSDGGENWSWLGADSVKGSSFGYSFGPAVEEVRFCLAMPYQESNLRQFIARHEGNPHFKVEEHSTTKKGRTTVRFRVGRLDGEARYRVVLSGRHHSCEMMASWAMEGLLEAVLGEAETGAWFLDNVEIALVPLMDTDGVEDGDQGKNRKPHDHNRDYLGRSIYPAVAALKEFVPGWSEGKLRIGLDMHCPYIRGGGDGPSSNQRVFLVGNPSADRQRNLDRFSETLQAVQCGPLRHDPKHNIAWGKAWNTLVEPKSCGRWMAEQPGILVGATIEIPYADVAGVPVTVDSAKALGQDLAKAIKVYLIETADR